MSPPKELAQALLPAGARRTPTSRFATPSHRVDRDNRNHRSWWNRQRFNPYPFGYGGYYAVPYAGFDSGVGAYAEPPVEPEPLTEAANKGLLRFVITPATGLDYYVDGTYIGSSSNLGAEFEINAGARQVEVRARGYKPATFDARINEGRVTTLRGALEAVEQRQPPRSTASRVMYVIPSCYVGNTKPEAASLPAGCDVRKMVTRGAGL